MGISSQDMRGMRDPSPPPAPSRKASSRCGCGRTHREGRGWFTGAAVEVGGGDRGSRACRRIEERHTGFKSGWGGGKAS